MPLNYEELTLRSERIDWYCDKIERDADRGLALLASDASSNKVKKTTHALRIAVLAEAIARSIIEPTEVPAEYADEVAAKWLKEAANRERDEAAAIGTSVHDLLDRLSYDDEDDYVNSTILDEELPFVNSWRAWRAHYQIRFIDTEFTVFNLRHGYAGTGDFLARSELYPEWGLILGDYKTSKSGIWPSAALQLAAIRNGEFIARCGECEKDGDARCHRSHSPESAYRDFHHLKYIKTCIGVQITATGFHTVPVRAGDAQFNTFLHALAISRWKTEGEKFALLKDQEPEFLVDHESGEIRIKEKRRRA